LERGNLILGRKIKIKIKINIIIRNSQTDMSLNSSYISANICGYLQIILMARGISLGSFGCP